MTVHNAFSKKAFGNQGVGGQMWEMNLLDLECNSKKYNMVGG